jgi:hypothetical protein
MKTKWVKVRTEIEKTYRADIAALETSWKLINKTEPPDYNYDKYCEELLLKNQSRNQKDD